MSIRVDSLKSAGLLMLLIAVMYGFAPVPQGLGQSAGIYLVLAAVCCLLAVGLRRAYRWVDWIAFLVTLIGTVAVYINSGSGTMLQNGWHSALVIINLIATLQLFICLWKSSHSSA